jgi:hypothetical protein
MRSLGRAAVAAASLVVAALAAVAVGTPAYADDPPAPPGTPTATASSGIPTVGPLFSGPVTGRHGCTASVIASPGQNLILTAAHCVSGTARGWLFAPGYDNGATPYGVWTVVGAYVSPQWTRSQDPQHDYAILAVAPRTVDGHRTQLQQVTGANLLGVAPPTGTTITDLAYNGGVGGAAITCTVPVYYTDGFPGFNCHGYVGGSSGSPWLARLGPSHAYAVVGLIAGLHQGGCYEYTSYSPALHLDAYQLLLRASSGGPADTVPPAGSDGC